MHIRNGAMRILITWIVLSAALRPPELRAQTPAPAAEPPPRLEGSAQAALLATTGNASAQAVGLGGEIVWRPTPWVLKAKAAFAQTETDDELNARSTVAAIRADRFMSPRTSLYGQYEYLRDLFAGIEQRSTVSGGVAYRLLDRSAHRLTIDGGLGFQHEGRVEQESEDLAIATGGFAYRWEISSTSALAEEFRYVQALETLEARSINFADRCDYIDLLAQVFQHRPLRERAGAGI